MYMHTHQLSRIDLTTATCSSSSTGSPPSADAISCLSLVLQLLGLLLSSDVTGREELPDLAAINRRKAREEEKEEGEEDDDEDEEVMHENNSTSGSESSRLREGNYEVRTVGFPKPLLKMMVTSAKAGDLLEELRSALEVGKYQ